jgi:hypothetical protein
MSSWAGRRRHRPAAVASVEEGKRHPAFGGWHQVAVVTMVNRERFVVEDGARRAAKVIREAKAARSAS